MSGARFVEYVGFIEFMEFKGFPCEVSVLERRRLPV